MSDEPDSLTLRYLRRLDDRMERVFDELREVKQRLTALETSEAGHYAATMSRLDRMEIRLDRIERRLDLTDVSA